MGYSWSLRGTVFGFGVVLHLIYGVLLIGIHGRSPSNQRGQENSDTEGNNVDGCAQCENHRLESDRYLHG